MIMITMMVRMVMIMMMRWRRKRITATKMKLISLRRWHAFANLEQRTVETELKWMN